MENKYLKYIQGSGRKDLTLLFADHKAFQEVIDLMSQPFLESRITKVVGLDALGFVFVAPIAQKLNTGFALMRKEGKVPVEKKSISFTDYSNTTKTFEVASNGINPGDRILLVDEWSETGSQLRAAIALIHSMNAEVVGITCFNIDEEVENSTDLSQYKMYSVL